MRGTQGGNIFVTSFDRSGWMASLAGLSEIWSGFMREKFFGMINAIGEILEEIFWTIFINILSILAFIVLLVAEAVERLLVVCKMMRSWLRILRIYLRLLWRRIAKWLHKLHPVTLGLLRLALVCLLLLASYGLFLLLAALASIPFALWLLCAMAAIGAFITLIAATLKHTATAVAALIVALLSMLGMMLGGLFGPSKDVTAPVETPKLPAVSMPLLDVARPEITLSVIDVKVARPGYGCIKMTISTRLPLGLDRCKDLSGAVGRKVVPKSDIIMAPEVKLGETWYLVINESDTLAWLIPDYENVYRLVTLDKK